MTVSVYLSNESIVVVSGKALKSIIKVNSFVTIPLPEGTLINGMIINDELIRSYLIKLRIKGILPKKNVRLVIDRSSVLVKFLKIPKMKENHVIKLIENTFSGAAQARNELVYDYSVIDAAETKGDGNKILGCAIEESFVEDYINLFKSAGAKLASIDIGLNSILKFHNYCNKYKNKTFVLSFVDADNIFSMLFINGKYSFSNRFRLIKKRGTAESFVEFGNFLSSIVQFNKTQKDNQDIELALYCGLREDEEVLCEELSSSLNIKVERFVKCSAIVPKRRIINKEPELIKNLFAVANLIK